MSAPPPAIATSRLTLEVLTPEVIRLLLAHELAAAEAALGVSLPAEFADERVGWLRRHLGLMEAHPARSEWCARLMRLDGSRAAAGHCGFHGPPEVIGRAEIGYTVFEPYRGAGLAKEAAAGLVAWAFEQGESEVYASVSPANAPSLAVVRSLGFEQAGVQEDPVNGTELVFRVTPAALRSPGRRRS